MVQVLEKRSLGEIVVNESIDIYEIRDAFELMLYVPDVRIKQKVVQTLLDYILSKSNNPDYKLRVFIAYQDYELQGFVIAQKDPYYTSYSRKCGTFGWLHAKNVKVCKKLLKKCEQFLKENKLRKIRGPINFPKSLGGIGLQSEGFEQQMLYGVAFSSPELNIFNFLEDLGYRKESEYTCLYVAQRSWNKGKKIDKDIEFRYTSLKELYDYADEIRDLAKNSFYEILADSSGRNRVYEFFEAFSNIPKSFYNISTDFDPDSYCDIPQFTEAWETCDLKKVEPYAPMAFDKTTNELVGILLGLPDLFEVWNGSPLTRANVDTAMVKKGYFGKGIFSALNNIGQFTGNLYGIDYFEGTGVWSNNSRAIDTIFPHCEPIRKHYVFQKRI